MKNKLLIFGLIVLIFIIQSCNIVDSSNVESKIAMQTPTPQNENVSEKKIEFKGVSFTYNPQIFGEVETEEKAEQPLELESDKPDNVAPKHILFSLKTSNERESDIAVYPIEEYRRVWKRVEKNNTFYFDEQLKNLKKALKDKDFRVKNEVPHIRYYDAHQAIIAKSKHIRFQNGKSLCFLTQIEQDRSIINNEKTEYYCQGITDDEKYFFLAVFSIKISFLPKDFYVDDFEGYKIPERVNLTKKEETQYKNYISKLTERINNLSDQDFEPNLNELEKVISTLKIEK